MKNRLRHIPLRHIPANETEQQLFELMYERAMTGLDDERQAEYERRAAQHPDLDVDCYERAAAAGASGAAERLKRLYTRGL